MTNNQSLTFRIFIAFFILMTVSCKTYHKVDSEVMTYRINDELGERDEDIADMVQPYRSELEQEMNRVLCQNPQLMEKGKPESTLTNWFCDVLMAAAKETFEEDLAFAAQNYGGVRRTQMAAGAVTVGTIYEIMPFDNEMIALQMTGEQVQAFCDRMAHSGGWPISKELRFNIRYSKATDITIKGEPLQEEETYFVVLNDYIANGGDGLTMLRSMPRLQKGVLLRDAVINQLEGQQTIDHVGRDGRITLLNDEQ